LEVAALTGLEDLSPDDLSREIVAEILRVVPASHWSFARFGDRGLSDQLLLTDTHTNRQEEFEHLKTELALQREHTAKGPRMAATLDSLQAPYTSGIVLVFADTRREFGLLRLLRAEERGPFTSVEVQALALALDGAIDRLSGLALASSMDEREATLASEQPFMHVLDRDLNVVLTWERSRAQNAMPAAIRTRPAMRLPTVIEDAVRDLIADWTSDIAEQTPGVAQPVPFLTVRAQRLAGPMGTFVGVLLQRPEGAQVFGRAARAFALSPREVETLSLLLPGATLGEVAKAMHITPSTVQDHIKSMLHKTGSRNRSELIAKLLNPQ
jgi:DNA-binding CsgD family transcriptional regulator